MKKLVVAVGMILLLHPVVSHSATPKLHHPKRFEVDLSLLSIKAVYHRGADEPELPKWKQRLANVLAELADFHRVEFGSSSKIKTSIHPKPIQGRLPWQKYATIGGFLQWNVTHDVEPVVPYPTKGYAVLLIFTSVGTVPNRGGCATVRSWDKGCAVITGDITLQLPTRRKRFGDLGALGSVVYHELGHSYGLDHPPSLNFHADSIMSQGTFKGLDKTYIDPGQLSLMYSPSPATRKLVGIGGLRGSYFRGSLAAQNPDVFRDPSIMLKGQPNVAFIKKRIDPSISFGSNTMVNGKRAVFQWGPDIGSQTNFFVEWDGFLKIPQDGTYWFAVDSDDDALLWIDGALVVDNGGAHAPWRSVSGRRKLSAGRHRIKIRYAQWGGETLCNLLWGSDGRIFVPIAPKFLSPPGARNSRSF